MDRDHPQYSEVGFERVSLFGFHECVNADSYKWSSSPSANVFVYAHKTEPEGSDVYFEIYSPALGVSVTSSVYPNVYDGGKWNFAVRMYPEPGNDLTDFVDGSTLGTTGYIIELYGVNMLLDVVENEFTISAPVTQTPAQAFLHANKRVYMGALYKDSNVKIIDSCDVKMSGVRYWLDYIDNDTIKAHARDASNAGRMNPMKPAYFAQSSLSPSGKGIHVPQKDTLALHWDFSNVTGSSPDDGSGILSDSTFYVYDLTSGSSDYSDYGWISTVVDVDYPGVGDKWYPDSKQVVDTNYVLSAYQQLPENLQSADTVKILTGQSDDLNYTKESEPINHFFAVEKSMYATISEEILNVFATIKDFNNLIGDPVNRYRMDYKMLGKLRQSFFDTIGNTPKVDRYVEFYKWLDASLGYMIQELIPASANFSEGMRTMVEPHVLERNKYWTKYPTLEMKQEPPQATARGVHELGYDWKHGHATLPTAAATAVLVVGSYANNGETITLIDTDGDSVTFEITGGVTTADGTKNASGNVIIGQSGVSSFSDFATRIRAVINAQTDAAITASGTSTSITLTQDLMGVNGNTAIVNNLSGFSIPYGFGNGAGDGEESQNSLWWAEQAARDMRQLSAETQATATISFASYCNDGETLVLTDGSGKSTTFQVTGGVTTADGTKNGLGYIIVGQSGLASLEAFADRWIAVINAQKDVSITASDPGGTGDVLLTQDSGGAHGNTAITHNLSAATISAAFAGGLGSDAVRTTVQSVKIKDIDGYWGNKNPRLYKGRTNTVYQGSTYAIQRLGRPYRFAVQAPQTIHGGTNFPVNKRNSNDFIRGLPAGIQTGSLDFYDELNAEALSTDNLASRFPLDKKPKDDAMTVVDNAVAGHTGAGGQFKSSFQSPWSIYEDVNTGTEYKANIHDDSYGPQKETAMQGPFTHAHVGGNQHRHVDVKLSTEAKASTSFEFHPTNYASANNGTITLISTDGTSVTYKVINTGAGDATASDQEFDAAGSATTTATNFITLVNSSNGHAGKIVATSAGGVVTLTQNVAGAAGNRDVVTAAGFMTNCVKNTMHAASGLAAGAIEPFTIGQRATDRPELWRFTGLGSSIAHPQAFMDAAVAYGVFYPAANRLRDETAKRPVNLRNIKSTTGSVNLGNYARDYEILQTFGRGEQNRWLVKSGSLHEKLVPVTVSPAVSGVFDYTLPVRGRSEHVITSRFSAPGAPDTLGLGSTDLESGELSPYNNLNYRNLDVRNHLKMWQAEHTLIGGGREEWFAGGYPGGMLAETSGAGNWHKVNRNAAHTVDAHGYLSNFNQTLYKPSGSTQYDNWYVQHQIPRSDYQYSWVHNSYKEDLVTGAATVVIVVNSGGKTGGTYTSNMNGKSLTLETPHDTIPAMVEGGGIWSKGANGVEGATSLVAAINNKDTGSRAGHFYTASLFDVDPSGVSASILIKPIWAANHGTGKISDTELDEVTFTDTHSTIKTTKYSVAGSGTARKFDGSQAHLRRGYVTRFDNLSIGMSRTHNYGSPEYNHQLQFPTASDIGVVTSGAGDFASIPIPHGYFFAKQGYGKSHGADKDTVVNPYIPVDFVNLNTIIYEPINTASNTVGYTSSKFDWKTTSTPSTTDVYGNWNYINQQFVTGLPSVDGERAMVAHDGYALGMAASTNALINHRHGPWGWGSWKQVRSGQNPVWRAHRKSNTISVMDRPVIRNFTSSAGREVVFRDSRSDTFVNYIEPSVAWNLPMTHRLNMDGSDLGSRLKHPYSNNLECYANPHLTNRIGKVKCSTDQMYDQLYSLYAGDSVDSQIDFVSLKYSEYIYPKHRHVTLNKVRSRTEYAEVAGTGSNGYDRNSGIIRSFWRDISCSNEVSTSVTGNHFGEQLKDGIRIRSTGSVNAVYGKQATARYNLQWNWMAIKAGWAGMGSNRASYESWEDVVADMASSYNGCFENAQHVNDNASKIQRSNHYRYQFDSIWCMDDFDNGITYAAQVLSEINNTETTDDQQTFPLVYRKEYKGDLAYMGLERMMRMVRPTSSFIEAVSSFSTAKSRLMNGSTQVVWTKPAPRAQLQYIHQCQSDVAEEAGLPWHTPKVSGAIGRYPWYNDYEDYDADIRSATKKYTVVPEFNISSHMSHYVTINGGDFRVDNKDFLELPGGGITGSGKSEAKLTTTYSHDEGTTFETSYTGEPNKAIVNGGFVAAKTNHGIITLARNSYLNDEFLNTVTSSLQTSVDSSPNAALAFNVDDSGEMHTSTYASASALGTTAAADFVAEIHDTNDRLWAHLDSTVDLSTTGGNYFTEYTLGGTGVNTSSDTYSMVTKGFVDAPWGQLTKAAGGPGPTDATTTALGKTARQGTPFFTSFWVKLPENVDDEDMQNRYVGSYGYAGFSGSYSDDEMPNATSVISPMSDEESFGGASSLYEQEGNRHQDKIEGDSYDPVNATIANYWQGMWLRRSSEHCAGGTGKVPEFVGGTEVQTRKQLHWFDTRCNNADVGNYHLTAADGATHDINPQGQVDSFFESLGTLTGDSNQPGEDQKNIVRFWNDPELNNPTVIEPGIWTHIAVQYIPPVAIDKGGAGSNLKYAGTDGDLALENAGNSCIRVWVNGSPVYGMLQRANLGLWDNVGTHNVGTAYYSFKGGSNAAGLSDNNGLDHTKLGVATWNDVDGLAQPHAYDSDSTYLPAVNNKTDDEPHVNTGTEDDVPVSFYESKASGYANISAFPDAATPLRNSSFAKANTTTSPEWTYISDVKIGTSYLTKKPGAGAPFYGQMDEFVIARGMLSSTDVTRVYNHGKPVNVNALFYDAELAANEYGETSGVRAAIKGTTCHPFVITNPHVVNKTEVYKRNSSYESTVSSSGTCTSWNANELIMNAEDEADDWDRYGHTPNLVAWYRMGVPPTSKQVGSSLEFNDKFFDTYAHTDTIVHMDKIAQDHQNLNGASSPRFTLKVNAVKKLLPYNGFYPNQRSVQIGKLFADAMFDNITAADGLETDQIRQACLQPFMAPGILYNTVKAGIAVDWPLFTGTDNLALNPMEALMDEYTKPNFYGEVQRNVVEDTSNNDENRQFLERQTDNSLKDVYDEVFMYQGRKKMQGFKLVRLNTAAKNDTRQAQPMAIRRTDPNPPFSDDSQDGKIWLSQSCGYLIDRTPDMRLPFEALVDLSLLPRKDSSTQWSSARIYMTAPTYYRGDELGYPHLPSYLWNTNTDMKLASGTPWVYPYFEWNGEKDNLYELAMHNFLAETPKFFLKNKGMVTFASQPENRFKSMVSGTVYYMDVNLHKSENFDMMVSPYGSEESGRTAGREELRQDEELAVSVPRSTKGRYFGPPFRYKTNGEVITIDPSEFYDDPDMHRMYEVLTGGGEDSVQDDHAAGMLVTSSALYEGDNDLAKIQDPAQAPYTPPYFYGRATARLSFVATETKKYTLDEILAGVEIEDLNPEAAELFRSVNVNSDGVGYIVS